MREGDQAGMVATLGSPSRDRVLPATGPTGGPWEELERRSRALLAEAACRPGGGAAIGIDWLASASQWLAGAAAGGWEDLVGPLPEQRSYRRVAASPQLEAWVICWPQGGQLQLHDHGGASGAFTVVAGVLEEHYLPTGRGSLRRRRLGPEEGVSFDGRYLHDVRNVERVPVTSIHVYNRAERPMAFYRLAGGRPRLQSSVGDTAAVVEPPGVEPGATGPASGGIRGWAPGRLESSPATAG